MSECEACFGEGQDAACDICPTCKRPLSSPAPRVCAECGQPITRHHKYRFRADGRIEHRHCDNPEAYLPREEPASE